MKSFLNCIQCILLLAAGVMVGCGGGGGSSGSGGGGGATALPATPELRATAQNRPEFGSVHQGSRAEGGVTVDLAEVTYPDPSNGAVTVTIRNIDTDQNLAGVQPAVTTYTGSDQSYSTSGERAAGDAYDERDVRETSSYPYTANARVFEQVRAGRAMRYIDSYNGDYHVVVKAGQSGGTESFAWFNHGLRAEFFTTHDGTNDDNYLTFGGWLYFAPGTGRRLAAIEAAEGEGAITYADFLSNGGHYGLFVDGTEHTGDLPTTGRASYAGFTYGAGESSTLAAGYLLGRVSLTATFGGAGNTRVAGTISDFAHYTSIVPGNDPFGNGALPAAGSRDPGWGTVYLQAATINNGQFEGDTSRRQNGPDMGNWGGQFFGNDENSLEPPMFGGTWGVADETNGVRMTGAFGTWKQ